MAVHAYPLSAGMVKVGESAVQSCSQLPYEVKANLALWDSVFKNGKNKKIKENVLELDYLW